MYPQKGFMQVKFPFESSRPFITHINLDWKAQKNIEFCFSFCLRINHCWWPMNAIASTVISNNYFLNFRFFFSILFTFSWYKLQYAIWIWYLCKTINYIYVFKDIMVQINKTHLLVHVPVYFDNHVIYECVVVSFQHTLYLFIRWIKVQWNDMKLHTS